MISRRAFGQAVLAAPFTQAAHGVRLGVTGYSFQHLSLDDAIRGMQQIGLSTCETWYRHIEPKLPREELRAWRIAAPLELFRSVAEKHKAAGIAIVAYTYDMKEDFTDGELRAGFDMARALGVKRIATSTTFTVARRIVPLMEEYKMEVAFHGHANAEDPNQFAGPDSFRRVLGMSLHARINLDIGQFQAAGFDPVPFIREMHRHIPLLHIRDGKRGAGTKLPWGEGDTPIREVLQLLRREKYPMAADIECDYRGTDDVSEVRKCLRYCENALAY